MEKLLILLITVVLPVYCMAQGKDVFDTARTGTVEEMKVLLQKNSDTINVVSPSGFTPLILACYRGNTPVAAFLAKNVKDVNYNSSNGTALAAAAVKGDVAVAKVLLENRANPDIADVSGVTPLIYAVQFKNKELVSLLLTYKARTDIRDNEGKSARDHALFSKNEEIINLLNN